MHQKFVLYSLTFTLIVYVFITSSVINNWWGISGFDNTCGEPVTYKTDQSVYSTTDKTAEECVPIKLPDVICWDSYRMNQVTMESIQKWLSPHEYVSNCSKINAEERKKRIAFYFKYAPTPKIQELLEKDEIPYIEVLSSGVSRVHFIPVWPSDMLEIKSPIQRVHFASDKIIVGDALILPYDEKRITESTLNINLRKKLLQEFLDTVPTTTTPQHKTENPELPIKKIKTIPMETSLWYPLMVNIIPFLVLFLFFLLYLLLREELKEDKRIIELNFEGKIEAFDSNGENKLIISSFGDHLVGLVVHHGPKKLQHLYTRC